MSQILKDYFTFNNREKRGIIVLLSIIFILLVWLQFSSYLFKQEQVDFSAFAKEIQQLKSEELEGDSISAPSKLQTTEEKVVSINKNTAKFSFNPNHLSNEEWLILGLSDKQIETINNYKSKGGKFHKKEDLKKIYGISEQTYLALEPYIQIPDDSIFKVRFSNNHSSSVKGKVAIEINTADSISLVQLRGIGPAFAKRIIAFRNKMGGYVKKEQLLEVYGLDSTTYLSLLPQISLDTSIIKKLNVNTSSWQELKNHPYIGYKLSQLIVNFRNKHGKYNSIEGLAQIKAIDGVTLKKISGYLTF